MKKFLKYFIFCFVFAACNTLQHQQRKAQTFVQQHPERLAQWCSESFPEKDSIGETDTVYVKADNKDYTQTIDSLQSALDSSLQYAFVIQNGIDSNEYNALKVHVQSLINQISYLKGNYKPCKPDTLKLLDTLFIKNPALIAANVYFKFQRDSTQDEQIKTKALLDDKKQSLKRDTWIIIILSAIVAGGAFLKIKKFI